MSKLIDFYIPLDSVLMKRVENSCFVYAPLPSDPLEGMRRQILDQVDVEVDKVYDADKFHITLLYIEDCGLSEISELVSQFMPPIQFEVELASLEVFDEGEVPVLVWRINPDPALLRLQSDLYFRAENQNLPISPFSKPEIYKPHVTVAYLKGVPRDIPSITPFKIAVNRFKVGRDDDNALFTVHLSTGRGERFFVEAHPESNGHTEITQSELKSILSGERIVYGPQRRILSLNDGPFSLRHGKHSGQQGVEGEQGGSAPGFTHENGETFDWMGHEAFKVDDRTIAKGKFAAKGQFAVVETTGEKGMLSNWEDTVESAIADAKKREQILEVGKQDKVEWEQARRSLISDWLETGEINEKVALRLANQKTPRFRRNLAIHYLREVFGLRDVDAKKIVAGTSSAGMSSAGNRLWRVEDIAQRGLEALLRRSVERHGKHSGQEGVEGQQGGSAPGFTHNGTGGKVWSESLKREVMEFIHESREIVEPSTIGSRFKAATILPDGRVALSGDAHENLRKSIFNEFGEEEFPGDQAKFGLVDGAEFKAQGFVRTNLIMQTSSGIPLVYFELDPGAITSPVRQAMRDIYWAAFKPDIGPPNVAIDWEDSDGTWHSIGTSSIGGDAVTLEQINRELGFKIDRSLIDRHGTRQGQTSVEGQQESEDLMKADPGGSGERLNNKLIPGRKLFNREYFEILEVRQPYEEEDVVKLMSEVYEWPTAATILLDEALYWPDADKLEAQREESEYRERVKMSVESRMIQEGLDQLYDMKSSTFALDIYDDVLLQLENSVIEDLMRDLVFMRMAPLTEEEIDAEIDRAIDKARRGPIDAGYIIGKTEIGEIAAFARTRSRKQVPRINEGSDPGSWLELRYLVVKKSGMGFGAQMMGEVFQLASENSSGLYAGYNENSLAFFKEFGATIDKDKEVAFWINDEVKILAERATEESIVVRETLDEVDIGGQGIQKKEIDLEPNTGVFADIVDWVSIPRNWIYKIARESEVFISPEDQAVFDARKRGERKQRGAEEDQFLSDVLGKRSILDEASDLFARLSTVFRHGDHVGQEGRSPEQGGSKPGFTHNGAGGDGVGEGERKISEPIFHGTGAEAAKSIMKTGLQVNFADDNNNVSSVIYAASDRRDALFFAGRSSEKEYALITIDSSLAGSKPATSDRGELMFSKDIPSESIVRVEIYLRGFQRKDDQLIKTIERSGEKSLQLFVLAEITGSGEYSILGPEKESVLEKALVDLKDVVKLLVKRQDATLPPTNIRSPDVHVNVEPPDIHVNVEPPDVHVSIEPPDVRVNVESPDVKIELAPKIEIDMPEHEQIMVVERDEEGFIKKIIKRFSRGRIKDLDSGFEGKSISNIVRSSLGLSPKEDE